MGKENPLWSPEIVEMMASLWENHHSATDIAKAVAEKAKLHCTASMVISKLKRTGLDARRKAAPLKVKQERNQKKGRPGSLHYKAQPAAVLPPKLPLQAMPVCKVEPLVPGGVALADMESNQCRFAVTPHDAPSHRFCGHRVKPGKKWCSGHYKVVYRPVEHRERTNMVRRALRV